jgi:hypothetical protein
MIEQQHGALPRSFGGGARRADRLVERLLVVHELGTAFPQEAADLVAYLVGLK